MSLSRTISRKDKPKRKCPKCHSNGGQCTVCSCLSEAQKILEEAEKNEDQT